VRFQPAQPGAFSTGLDSPGVAPSHRQAESGRSTLCLGLPALIRRAFARTFARRRRKEDPCEETVRDARGGCAPGHGAGPSGDVSSGSGSSRARHGRLTRTRAAPGRGSAAAGSHRPAADIRLRRGERQPQQPLAPRVGGIGSGWRQRCCSSWCLPSRNQPPRPLRARHDPRRVQLERDLLRVLSLRSSDSSPVIALAPKPAPRWQLRGTPRPFLTGVPVAPARTPAGGSEGRTV
jgi:hypothetical protein